MREVGDSLLPGAGARRRALHLVVGRPQEYKADLFAEALDGESTWWTVNSSARRGDRSLFYMTAPDMAVVMRGTILTDAELDDDPRSEWEGHYFSEIGELEIFVEAVTRAEIMRAVPGWRHIRQAQKSARVREEVRGEVEKLFDRPVVPRPEKHPRLDYVTMHYQHRRMYLEDTARVAANRERLVEALSSKFGATADQVRRHVAANMRAHPGMSFDHALDGVASYHDVILLAWEGG